MRVDIGDIRLFVDVLGPAIVAHGWEWRTRPTLVLIHGGPGFDHLAFRQAGLPYEQLSDFVRVILVDLRGCGASDTSDAAHWNLATWASDLVRLFDLLGLQRPIVLGESGGGFVVAELAGRAPDRIGGVILANTSARWRIDTVARAFERRGGTAAGDVARRFWTNPHDLEAAAAYAEQCIPLYSPAAPTADEPPPHSGLTLASELIPSRTRYNHDVLAHFATNEMDSFDHLEAIADYQGPVLVIAGVDDPICPVEDSDAITAARAGRRTTYERVEGAGHTVAAADPRRFAEAVVRFLADASKAVPSEHHG